MSPLPHSPPERLPYASLASSNNNEINRHYHPGISFKAMGMLVSKRADSHSQQANNQHSDRHRQVFVAYLV